MKERAESEQVSPTAFATGYFWYRHGLSHPGLVGPEGERLYRRFRMLMGLVKGVSGMSIEAMMLARHRGIDAVLGRYVESGTVGQVIEIAAGLSARGWRFTERYGQRLAYVETDLPHMVDLKRRLLDKADLKRPGHRVVPLDALLDRGPGSLHELAKSLDPKQGLAIVTEGLMSYLDPHTANAVWRRIAGTLHAFPFGVYLSDCYVRSDRYGLGGALFRGVIQRFVRGRMHVHFENVAQATRVLQGAGFGAVALHEPRNIAETRELGSVRGGNRVRILEAIAAGY
jgi:O-methyltransferase involved in polyketide biosynthesis